MSESGAIIIVLHVCKRDVGTKVLSMCDVRAELDAALLAHGHQLGLLLVVHAELLLGDAQRPNLKSEDSGFRHRFSGAKVSLWMCENGTGLEESRGPTRR